MKLLFCLLISLSSFAAQQDSIPKIDTTKKIIDSVLTYPDTVVFKIPSKYVSEFISMLNGDDNHVLLSDFKIIGALINQQRLRQILKKPKK